MSTQNVYTGFFPRQIIGRSTLKDDLHGSIRTDFDDAFGESLGEGVIDPSSNGLAILVSADPVNDRRLTISGDLTAINNDGNVFKNLGNGSSTVTLVEGARTITLHSPSWFVDLPYEDNPATTYRTYIGLTRYPVDVQIGRNGNRGYGRWVDAPGFTVAAETVTDGGTHIILGVDANLTALGMQRWLTGNTNDASWSYDVVVYLDEDVAGVDIASDDSDTAIAYFAKLKKTNVGNGWRIDLSDASTCLLYTSDAADE